MLVDLRNNFSVTCAHLFSWTLQLLLILQKLVKKREWHEDDGLSYRLCVAAPIPHYQNSMYCVCPCSVSSMHVGLLTYAQLKLQGAFHLSDLHGHLH